MQSETRSQSTDAPTWDENWLLLRRLWPEWAPTDEQAREVWWRSFDKRHGVRGELYVNQIALKEAILGHARSSKWKEPKFLDIADQYRREVNATLSHLDRVGHRTTTDREQVEVEHEHEQRIERIGHWTPERLRVAQEHLARVATTFVGKSPDPSTWSKVYSGMLVAADQEVQRGEAEP